MNSRITVAKTTAVLLLSLLLGSPALHAQTVATWDGTSGSWSDAFRWDSAGFPNNGAGTFNAIVNAGTVSLDQDIIINGLILNAGTLSGGFDLTMMTGSQWSGGTLSGAGTTTFNGLDFSSANGRVLDRTVNLNGISTFQGALNTGGAVINNTGNVQLVADTNILYNLGGSRSTFNNMGSFQKTAGGGVSLLTMDFNNSGGVDVGGGGTLRIANGTNSHSGSWNLSSGDLEFSNSNNTFETGTTVTGTGTTALIFSGGTQDFNAGTYNMGGTTRIANGRVNYNFAATTNILEVSGGSALIGGSDTLTSSGLFNWTGGGVDGGTVQADGGIDISGFNHDMRSGGVINNAGVANWSGGDIRNGSAASFNNQIGGTFNATGDNNYTNGFGGAASAFNNAGTFTKSGSTGVTDINSGVTFNNSGIVNVNSGTLRMRGGGVSTGAWNANTGTIEFGTGTHELNAGTSVSGDGTVEFTGSGTTNFNAGSYNVSGLTRVNGAFANFNSNATTGQLEISLSSVGGSGTLTATELFTWTGGGVVGATVQADGGINISGFNHDMRSGGVINNAGVANWSGGDIRNGSAASFNNQIGGTFNATGDNNYTNGFGGAASAFNNAGTFTKSGSTGVTDINSGVAFNNSGIVNVNSGTLRMRGGGVSTGAWNANTGTIEFGSGTHELNAGTSVAGDGTVEFTGTGTTNFNAGSYNVTGLTHVNGAFANFNSNATTGQLEISSLNVGGSGTLTSTGLFTWTGGGVVGGTVQANGGIDISGVNHDMRSGGVINNAGVANWNSGDIRNGSGASFNNQIGGTFNATGDNNYTNGFGGAASAFNDAGTFTKSGSTGVTDFNSGVVFNNSGSVLANSGIIDFASYNQTAGSLMLAGGNVSAPTFAILGGDVSGDGTLLGDIDNLGGTIAPGFSAGQLTVSGDLLLGSGSQLLMEIGGLSQSTEYDFINVTGDSTLDGILSLDVINGFGSTIQTGDLFTVLTSSNLSGSFSNVDSGNLLNAGSRQFEIFYGNGSQYGANNVVARAFTSVPEPGTCGVLIVLAGIGFARRRRKKPIRRY